MTAPTRSHPLRRGAGFAAVAAALALAAVLPTARAATPSALLDGYRQAAGTTPSPARGQQFFTQSHGRDWRCSSCHGERPTGPGRHAATGKPIDALAPLAPTAEAGRFSDAAKAEKWFRRNCNDVVGRECSAAEKADVLAWLLTLPR